MLTHISIENFKGIRDRVELELKPITLLFGPNSAGKSTILHALLYAQEVFERHNLNADTTAAGGPFVDLGGFENMVHGRDLDVHIGLGLRFSLDAGEWSDYELDKDAFEYVLDCQADRLLATPTSAGIFLKICWSDRTRSPFVQSCQLQLDSTDFAEITVDPTSQSIKLLLPKPDHPLLERFDGESAGVQGLVGEEPSGYTAGSTACEDRSIFHSALEEVAVRQDSIELVRQEDALPRVESSVQFVKPVPFDAPGAGALRRTVRPSAPGVGTGALRGWKDADYRHKMDFDIKAFLDSTVTGILRSLRKRLRDFRYLGPVREIPHRNAAPPWSPDPARWSTGLGAWDRLQKCDDEFFTEVSDWLSDPKRLNAGVRLNRRDLIPLDLAQRVVADLRSGRLSPKKLDEAGQRLADLKTERRVFLVPNDSDIELSLHDVGVGLSQLVPVVVTALDKDKSTRLVAIEEPDYHLHPGLQAEVGDLFVEAARIRGKQCLIELHSEHVILRLQRLIRTGRFAASDLSVVHVRREGGTTLVRRLRLDDEGDFIDEWPGGFFPERLRELR